MKKEKNKNEQKCIDLLKILLYNGLNNRKGEKYDRDRRNSDNA